MRILASWASEQRGGGKAVIATDRRRGYRTAIRRHGLGDQVRILAGDNTEAAGERAVLRLLGGPRLPTAVATRSPG
ncbi:hypothetical protein ACWC0C_27850 [Streptomyces sp. NPDC001709]